MPLSEREKYEYLWGKVPRYRITSPGEQLVDFWRFNCEPSGSVNIYGCGPGRESLKMSRSGLDVRMFDIAENCLDPEVKDEIGDKFTRLDLSESDDIEKADFGYSVDVMEHFPPEQIDTVLKNIMSSCNQCFFQIALFDDVTEWTDEDIGNLHLTVREYAWWLFKLREYGTVVDARDCGVRAIFIVWSPGYDQTNV